MAFEQEGHTSILVGDKPTAFRFRVSVVNGERLQIWLEDVVTKEQWSTKDLAMTDYVDSQYVKLHSHQAAYAKDFVDCLLAGEDNKFFRHSLTSPFQENIRTLWLELLANFASRTSRFTYTFNLHLMVLDRIEVLASRVRDLEDENKSLKDVIERATQRNEALITLETVVETSPNTSLSWKSNGPYEPRDFQLDHAGQSIELVRGGRYLISLHFAEGTGTPYEMQINGEKWRTLSNSCAKVHHQTLSFMVCVAAKAQLRIVTRGANKSPAGSLLTVAPV